MVKKNKKITAGILIIGNEILSGRTKDQNVSCLASWLNDSLGIKIEEVRIVPDIEKKIIENVLNLSKRFSYVLTTGGIGPTHDDITAKSISKAFKKKYTYNKEAFGILKKYYGHKSFNDPRKKMAKMPEGSSLIYNPSSAAPGFIIKNVICLPGVPSILKSMLHNLKKYLKPGLKTYSQTISVQTIESKIARVLEKIQIKHKRHVEIGSYPFFRLGKIGVSVVIRSEKKKRLQSCHKEIIKILKKKRNKIF
ncbi:MAG: molybdenum cofactor biosynthesis protein [Candidatus Pelagibacterales bacterium]|nr:MAG: molybdenum cofactor biosynthesis protein [Pelagibacterales bacterium]